MHRRTRIVEIVCAVALLLGMSSGVVAQENSSGVTVSVRVQDESELLAVSGVYRSPDDWSIYPSVGGVAFGELQIDVSDTRPAAAGWYVNATMGAFTPASSPQSTITFRFELLTVISQVPANGVFNPALGTWLWPTVTILRSDLKPTAQVTWRTTLHVPPGLAPDIYSGTLTLDVYSGAPPP